MSDPIQPIRRETRECVCGQRIVFELEPVRGGEVEEERRVVAIYTESGARILQCPRCGTAVADLGESG